MSLPLTLTRALPVMRIRLADDYSYVLSEASDGEQSKTRSVETLCRHAVAP